MSFLITRIPGVFGFQTFLNDSLLKMSLNLRIFFLNFKNNVTERNLIYKYIKFNIKTRKFRHKYN